MFLAITKNMNIQNVKKSTTEKNTNGMAQEISEIMKSMQEDQQQFDKRVAELKSNICVTKVEKMTKL